ncbi:MAG: hypothetical protein M1820_006489 [Bogoriella megaspora]|nr:MAG: hypothetical protein M1820_006489 [Bogoriella megaspora]
MLGDHSSIAASLEDFEHSDRDTRSPLLEMPSCHSGFRSEYSESESDHQAPWAPPAWQKRGSGWFAKNESRHGTESGSRYSSPRYESADEGDLTLPANVPLPISPEKGRSPRQSAEPNAEGQLAFEPTFAGAPPPVLVPDNEIHSREVSAAPEAGNNYIRFAVRAEVQHGTDQINTAVEWARSKASSAFGTRRSGMLSISIVVIAYYMWCILVAPPHLGAAPDLIKVAGLARSFEPLIHYSENGVKQLGELQETGVAVWDLSETMRSSNMTSAPIIVNELDDLSSTLRGLGHELTKFFANVDGDVDGILMVMDWSRRELAQLSANPPGTATSVFDNVHNALSRAGVLERPNGSPTITGKVVRNLFGTPHSQRNKSVLQRTFSEFLGVLEDSIRDELRYATDLFKIFEDVDRKFLNLQRAANREQDTQDRMEDEFLSSMWVRMFGNVDLRLKKFEKNKELLATIRARTVSNKMVLTEHNSKLLQLQSSLESLRRKLASPLLRRNDTSTLSIEEQIMGLEDTYEHLRLVREEQKREVMQYVYSSGSRRTVAREVPEIEARRVTARPHSSRP